MPKGGLNSSRNLEKDITGEYNLEDRVDTSNPDQPSTGQLSPVKSASQIQAEHADQNSQGAFDSSFNSSRSTDIAHGANSSLGTEAGVTSESDEAVGGPGSTEVGTSNSSSEEHSISEDIKASERSETGVPGRSSITTDSQDYLFKNNRAQGVGSAATGEFGVANSGQSTAAGMSDDALADKVKNALVKESTGTFGVTKPEARNIQVTAHDGVVTLKGSVPNERDRKMVEVHVAEISGVRRVDNQLTVSPSANPANRDLNSGSNLEDQTDELQR
jgi:osmotically-inducible protein OsmY